MCENTDWTLPRKEIEVEVYEGAGTPRVALDHNDRVGIKLRRHSELRDEAGALGEAEHDQKAPDESILAEGTMSISLESVQIEADNQSFGMITACTGCASNIGGPSC